MAKPNEQRIFQVMPEHCGGDLRGANEMRKACDAFFKRRGLNIYGGTKVGAVGMAAVVNASAERCKRRKERRTSDIEHRTSK